MNLDRVSPRPLPRLIVRSARTTDSEYLFDLTHSFAASARRSRGAFGLALNSILCDPSAWLAVAESETGVIGYCLGFDRFTLAASGRVAWIEEVMVRSVWRRKGVGRQLLTAFEEWARARGSRMVALATRESWPFFDALNYEETAFMYRKAL
ncbi:MAG TPA: GNAT family N-acetyltransferase [Anaeromyxobacteraceae bacterium]|nr:GNAT family N-acetyltransferase [Anaeromyxobacteraceae bacterium]